MIREKFVFDTAWDKAIELYRHLRKASAEHLTPSEERGLASRCAGQEGLAYDKGDVDRRLIDGIREVGNDHPEVGNPNHIAKRAGAWDAYSVRLRTDA